MTGPQAAANGGEVPAGACPSERPVWVLLGNRTGDNRQLLEAARELGLPTEVIQLRFAQTTRRNIYLGASLEGLENPQEIPAGAPRLVLSIGRRSPPVARWIRRRSGGRTRLVHFGRPWAPLSWFDLVITTPQYGLPQRRNRICNLLPFVAPARPVPIPESLASAFAAMPRPWIVVLLGGSSRPYVFDEGAADALAAHCNELAQRSHGSLFILAGPRTPEACAGRIRAQLRAPAYVYDGKSGQENPYAAMLHAGDRFVVTADSAMMLAEVLVASKPVELFPLPRKPDRRYRRAMAWQRAAAASALVNTVFEGLQDLGLLKPPRDIEAFHRALHEAGAFERVGAAADLSRSERAASIARIRALIAADDPAASA